MSLEIELCCCLHKACLINSEIIWNVFWLPNYVYKGNMQSLCLLWNYRELCGERKLWNVTLLLRKNNSLTLVHKNCWKNCTLLTSLWISCLKSVKKVMFEFSCDGYFDTKIFNFCHMVSLKFHTSFSVAQQLWTAWGLWNVLFKLQTQKWAFFQVFVRDSLLELMTLNFCNCNNECLISMKRINEVFLVPFILKPKQVINSHCYAFAWLHCLDPRKTDFS